MERVAQFRAGFYRFSTDREGASKVIFEVPLSEMPSLLKLSLVVGIPLVITVDTGDA
jgi:hypothetical protein